MESKQPLPPEHAETLLLPGYISRTLSSEERSHVERHVQSCPVCQEELQEMTAMQSALRSVIHTRPGPSPAAFAKVMSRIHQESTTPEKEVLERNEHSWWESLEHAFRSLFEVRWVPVLASFLIVGQAVLLLSVLGGPEGQNRPRTGPIIERGIPQGTPALPPMNVQVEFVETAQEFQIRRLIRDLEGKIVGGPTKDGQYILEFQLTDTSLESLLSTLRLHPDVIKTVEPLQP
jgi:hypothetical protein